MKLLIENSRRATETSKFVVSQLDAGTFCLTQGLLTTKGGERVLPVMTNRRRDGGGGSGRGGTGVCVPFSSFRSNTRVGISLDEVCERVRKSVISVCKRT